MVKTDGGGTVPAPVPGSRRAGSDQDIHANVHPADTGTSRCSEEADGVHEDLELPTAEAVLEVVLLPVDDITPDRRAMRRSARATARILLEAIDLIAIPAQLGTLPRRFRPTLARPGSRRGEQHRNALEEGIASAAGRAGAIIQLAPSRCSLIPGIPEALDPTGQLRCQLRLVGAADFTTRAGYEAADERTGAGRLVEHLVHAAGRELLAGNSVQTYRPDQD